MFCIILEIVLAFLAIRFIYINIYQWATCKPRFTGKTVLITGGSSGIGEQLAKRFIELDVAKVIIAARGVSELERVKSECSRPERVQVMRMDLSKPEEVLRSVEQQNFKVDILINNGGLSMREEFKDTQLSTCQYMMDTNCVSHIALIKALLPQMIARKTGHIVNILSVSGLMGVPVRTMYCASKFAMDGFSRALRGEVKPHGIKVTQVYPAYIQTNISKNAATGSGQSFGKLDENIGTGMPVEKAVDIILKGIYMERHEFVVGKVFYWIVPRLCMLSSSFNSLVGDVKYKSQLKVMNAAAKTD